MARVPDITRRRAISQVAPSGGKAGQGFAALSELARIGAEFVEPKARQQLKEAGFDATYRDENGVLQVREANVLGGEFADIHNSAAFSKYLSQRSIDMAETFTELGRKYEFDPAGFKAASDGYIELLREDENIPRALKEDLLSNAQREAGIRFNGLYNQETERNYRESDRNTSTHRDMLVDDYVNLVAGGDTEAAEAKLKEIEAISAFRANAPYISETPAETEAYVRGARGAAMVARMSRVMTDTSGSTELSAETRKEMEAIVNDASLSPIQRARLYAAAQGRLKGVDAAALVNTVTNDSYESKVVRVESGGKSTARNPNSTATGPHQFIRSTWLENVRELRRMGEAEWATGMRDDQILEMRVDPDASSEVFQHFRRKNAAILTNAGIPVNEGTEYLAHFLGAGGAVEVLKSGSSEKLSDILPAKTIEANTFLKNMTVADVQNWAARKMTMKASDIAVQRTVIDQVEDEEVRSMASALMNDRYGIRKRLEDAAALEYEERINAKDDSLTNQEIMADQGLSDSTQKALVSELKRQRKDQIEIQNTIANLADENTIWNPYDNKARSSVDKAFKSLLDGDEPLSAPGQTAAGEIAVRTGFLPKTMFDALRAGITSQDPQTLASSMEFLNQVIQRQPGAIDMHDGRKAVRDTLSDYRFYSGFMGSEEAAQRIIEQNDPEMVAKRKNLSDAAKQASKTLKPSDLVDHLEGRNIDANLGNETQQSEMMAEYQRLFEDAFVKVADPDVARNRALEDMSRVYGPNAVTGDSRLMKYPPQNFYPSSFLNPDWMQEAITRDVNEFVFGEAAQAKWSPLNQLRGTRIDPSAIRILSDERTREEVAARRAPSYTVMYEHEGEMQMVPGRYFFEQPDEGAARADLRRELDDQRAQESDVVNLRLWREHFRTQGLSEGEALRLVLEDRDTYRRAPPPQE